MVMQIVALALGITQILAFLDTNMLVSPTQNSYCPLSVFTMQWNIGYTVFAASIANDDCICKRNKKSCHYWPTLQLKF